MEFKRRGPLSKTFVCVSGEGDYRIVRPTGRGVRRDDLSVELEGRDFDIRNEGHEVWMLDDERLVGYAKGQETHWHLLIDDKAFAIEQEKLGSNSSVLKRGEETVGSFEGKGFPLKMVRFDDQVGFDSHTATFLVLVALVGWREGDRLLYRGAGGPGSMDPAVGP